MHFEMRPVPGNKAPVILLHGSESDEHALLDFGAAVAPGRTLIAPRGNVAWGSAYTFFRRNPDRSLDTNDLRQRTSELAAFVASLGPFERKPIIAGFSSGSIIAAALLHLDRGLSGGAVLMRPLAPYPDNNFPGLADYPVLVIDALQDQRRNPEDAPFIVAQLQAAGANVVRHSVPGDHPPVHEDEMLVRDWLSAQL